MIRFAAALLLLCMASTNGYAAEAYPVKPIRMVVGFVAGGPTDVLARLFAQQLGNALGQQVVVENRGGADGVIAADAVAKSAPDGYTLFFASAGHAINASLYARVPYRTIEDFAPITLVGESPNLIAVPPPLPVSTLQDFIALAKSKPGALNYGATSSPTLLATELFTSAAGIRIERIPFKGAAPAMAALMAGDVQMVISGIGTMLPNVKAGRLKALAVTSAERSPLAPDIPTVKEAGLDYVATTWYGLLAPAGTPPAIIERLNAAARTALNSAEMKQQVAPQGVVLRPMTADEFGRFIRSEVDRWGAVVKQTGIRIE